MVGDFFKDLFKLQNKKIVPMYLWFFLFSFILDIEDNFFICSYLRDEVFGKDENTMLVLIIYVLYYLGLFYWNRFKTNKANTPMSLYTTNLLIEMLLMRYRFYIAKFASFTYITLYNFRRFFLFNLFLSNNYKPYFFNTLIVYLFNIFDLRLIIWYPIYKTYSIFGYYKSTRLNFIDTKNENLKRLKS